MSEADAATYRRIPLEVFNEGRLDVLDEVLGADYVERVPLPPGMPDGREGVKAFVQAVRSAFADFNYTILHQISEGDLHFGHLQATGTMTGEFAGMPATGKSATWNEVHIGRFSDGKLVEHWAVVDQLGMLQQLGHAPMPGA